MTRRRIRVVVRFRGRRLRLGRFVSGSLAAHGALLAVILVIPMARHKAPPIEEATVVALSGPIGAEAAPPAAPRQAPAVAPAPAPAPPPKEAHTVREVPVPSPRETPKKDPKKERPPEPSKAPASPAAPPGGSQDTKPAAGAPAGAAAATGVTPTLGGGDLSLGWYQSAVKAALESAWIKPFLEDPGTTYSVTVAFDIARDGTVRDARITAPSGVPSLDRSALRAVLEASPLPGVPPTWKDDLLPATMRFDLTPEAR